MAGRALPPIQRVDPVEGKKELKLSEREILELHIRDLQGKITVASTRIVALEEENQRYSAELEKEARSKAEQYAVWADLQAQQASTIAHHASSIQKLKQEKEQAVEKLEIALRSLEEDKNAIEKRKSDEIDQLQRIIAKREALAELQEKLDEERLESKAQRAAERNIWQAKQAALEYKTVQDKKKLAEKFDQQVENLTQRMKSLSDSLMAETTKRTIIENIRLNKLIEDMSQSNRDLIQKNEEFLTEITQFKRQNEMYLASESVLAQKLQASKRVIRRLMDKIKGQEHMFKQSQVAQVAVENDVISGQERLNEAKHRIALLEAKLIDREREIKQAIEAKDQIAAEQEQLLGTLDSGAAFIVQCLQDLKLSKTTLDEDSAGQREEILTSMLDKLTSESLQRIPAASTNNSRPLSASVFRIASPAEDPKVTASKQPLPPVGGASSHAIFTSDRSWGKNATDLPTKERRPQEKLSRFA